MANGSPHRIGLRVGFGLMLALTANQAAAGPPFVSDDPEPTDYQHFEIYSFTTGTTTRDGLAGQSGIAVGAITPDRNSGSAFWVWAAIDNLRLAAESAAMIAGETV